MSRPALRPVAAWHYQQLLPICPDDDQYGWPWAHYCAALWGPVEDLADLISDRPDGTTGYALAMMVQTCPAGMLPWLGQQVGVTIAPGTTDAVARRMIRQTRGWHRGKVPAMIAEVQATLTGTRSVTIRERHLGPHHIRVITRTSQTPDPAATLAAAKHRGHKRIGITIDLLVVDGQTWGEASGVDGDPRTWGELTAAEPAMTWGEAVDTDREV